MRFLAAEGIVTSRGEDKYAHSDRSLVYTEQKNVDFFKLGYVFSSVEDYHKPRENSS